MSTGFDRLSQRGDYFESSCDQLKRALPTYLSHNSDMKKSLRALAAAFKNIAATESNANLKECLFDLAQKKQALSEVDLYQRCQEETMMLLDEARSTILQPLRDIVSDHQQAAEKITASAKSKGVPEAIHEQRVQQAQDSLPIHSALFEKHRVLHMKQLLETVLMTEMRYHCMALQELSPILQLLATVEP